LNVELTSRGQSPGWFSGGQQKWQSARLKKHAGPITRATPARQFSKPHLRTIRDNHEGPPGAGPGFKRRNRHPIDRHSRINHNTHFQNHLGGICIG